MNCQYTTLCSGKDGYVVRCKDCGHYQVAYRCVMVTLGEQSFHSFRLRLQQYYEASLSVPDDYCKCVVVPTDAADTRFLFTRREIRGFVELMDAADSEEQALALMDLFQPC